MSEGNAKARTAKAAWQRCPVPEPFDAGGVVLAGARVAVRAAVLLPDVWRAATWGPGAWPRAAGVTVTTKLK